jgi:cell wall-associated NlpC family hydrolase
VVSAVCGALTFVLLLAGTGAPAGAEGTVKPNAYAHVANTEGDNINVRGGADSSYDIRTTLEPNTVVWVLEGPIKGEDGKRWFRVDFDGRIGWVVADYLAPGKTGAGQTTAKSVGATVKASAVVSLKSGSYAKVAHTDGDMLRLRKSATSGGKVLDTIAPDVVVQVVKGPTKDADGINWYQVKVDGTTGWVMARYLTASAKPKTTTTAKTTTTTSTARGGTARGAAAAPKPPPAASSSAGGVVQVGLRYVGSRYRWGGTTPAGFDCSGFIYYVFNKAGVWMPRLMNSQIASGTRIGSGDLRPGDLVYFRNTYKRGISHIGIYVGNGRFVHAGSASTGVQVSALWSSYWAAHYAGAVRISR